MADEKKTTTPEATKSAEAIKAQAEAKAAKPKRVPLKAIFGSAEEAKKEADGRTKGPRRAFKASLNGKDYFVVANNEGRAGGEAFMKAGGTVEEIGKKSGGGAPKAMSIDAIMAAVNALPEAERAGVLAQLKGLTTPPAKK